MGPVPATRKALARAGLTIERHRRRRDQRSLRVAGGRLHPRARRSRDKVNIDGGGIAIGHPLGATGARITAKAAQILKREGGRYALATQCIGGGQGIATVIERL